MATVGNTGIHRSGSISDYLNNSYDGNDCIGLPWEYRLTTIDFGLDELMDLQAGPVELYKLPTIQSDVERISNRSRSISCSWYDIVDDIDSKAEIRNGDCMWSSFGAGTCSSNSNSNSNGVSNHNSNSSNGGSNSAASSYSESSAVPPAIVSGGASLIKREPEDEHEDAHETEDEEDNRTAPTTAATTTATLAEHINKLRSKTGTTATIPIPRPKASNGNILRYPSVKLSNSSSSNTAEQHIPPGASLLRKSNTKLQQMRYLSNLNNLSSSATLPSTLKTNSNDEHLSEFRHNVDLAACVMGSNNISLTQDSSSSCKSINNNNNNNDANNIDHLSRELQNKSKEFRIDKLPYRVPAVTPENIADVLDVISQHCDAAVSAAATLSPPASCSDGDSDDGECSVVDSSCGSATSLDGNCMQHISDHSYTRCNEMETTLETPSDSGEFTTFLPDSLSYELFELPSHNCTNCPRIRVTPSPPIESACASLHHTPSTSTSTHHTALHSPSIQLVLLPLPTLTWAHDDAPKNRSPTSTANVVNSASSGAHMLAAQFAGNLWEWKQQEEREKEVNGFGVKLSFH